MKRDFPVGRNLLPYQFWQGLSDEGKGHKEKNF